MRMNRGNEYEKKTMIFTTGLKKTEIKSYIIIWKQTNLKNIFKNYSKTVYKYFYSCYNKGTK